MHFTHTQHASGSKSTKFALVVVFHLLLGAGLIKTMNVRTLALPVVPQPIDLIPTITPPVTPPPPTSVPFEPLPAPAVVVPLVEVPVMAPPLQNTVTATTTVSDPVPLQPPAATATPTTTPGVTGDIPVPTVRPATMIDGCAKPPYPAQSARNGDAGRVTLALMIGVDGRVAASRIEQSSGFRELDKAALTAMTQCRFKPAMRGDVAQAGWALVAYDWKLE